MSETSNGEIPATMARPRDQNASGKTDKAGSAGYTHGKGVQRSKQDQVS